MPDAIDAIDWAALSHAYGAALDTAGELRALSSDDPDVRDKARRALSISVIHQGTHWPGSPEATQCIVDIALRDDARDVPELLDLLVYLATGFTYRWRRSVDALAKLGGEGDELWTRCHAAVAARLGELVPLLHSRHAKVRAHAAMLLAFFPDHATATAALLHRALDDEDPVVAGSAAVALAALARRSAIPPPIEALRARLGLDSRAGYGAALGLAWLGLERDPEVMARLATVIGEFERSAQRPPPLPFHEDPALAALEPYPRGADLPDPIADAVFSCLESNDARDRDHFWVSDRFEILLEKDFPPRTDGHAFDHLDLTPRQRAYLQIYATAKNVAGGNLALLLRDRGLPSDASWLGMFVGAEPTDLAFARRLFHFPDGRAVYWPTWRILHALSHAEGSIASGAAELARRFTPGELIFLFRHEVRFRLSWSFGEVRGHLDEAVRLQLGTSDIPTIDPLPYGKQSRWKTEPHVRDAMLDLWIAALEKRDLDDADAWIAAALAHAPPRQPWLDAIVAGLSPVRREAIVIAGLRARPGDVFDRESQPHDPAVRPAPWLHLATAPTLAVVETLLDLVPRLSPWNFPLAEVLTFLASLAEDIFDQIRTRFDSAEQLRSLVRRASWIRAGGIPDDTELRRDIHQWFRDGARLGSGASHMICMAPCPLCAQVFRELGIHPINIGAGALGGIEAPDSVSPDDERGMAFIATHWQEAFVCRGVDADDPWTRADEDPAITLAIDNAITSRPDIARPDRTCVELRILSRFARTLRSAYVKLATPAP